MDSVKFRQIKLEKSRKVMSFTSLRAFTSLFRLVELLLLLVLISKLYFRIPIAIKFSSDALKKAVIFIISPRFVFVLGNVIVITLFAKSGCYFQESSNTTEGVDLYKEIIQKNEKKSEFAEDKKEKREESRLMEEKRVHLTERIYKRSQSEKSFEAAKIKNSIVKLKRYESDKYLKICDSNMKLVKSSYQEDGMSNEEFKSKIESFIARQKRFQKDEEHFVI